MRAVLSTSKSDCGDPLVNQPSILPCAHVTRAIDAARKGIILDRSTAPLEPRKKAGADISGKLELHRPASLLLDDRGSSPSRSHAACCRWLGRKEHDPEGALPDRERSGSPRSASESAGVLSRPTFRHSTASVVPWQDQTESNPSYFSSAEIGRQRNGSIGAASSGPAADCQLLGASTCKLPFRWEGVYEQFV